MEGYIAITGPNGSGKSNITDAILFVLGPKSSKIIRAGKLTDLIYNGNKSAKKANYTKVTLYFDNTDRLLPWDANEVRFTRIVKISSNGEGYSSLFYINDHRSSMTEFDSLLMRARISADSYNMIQQGDVVNITKMGNVDRRRIIDNISGISSYDVDILKAENEKIEAEQNITTIQVVINELEKHLWQLREDMEAAKKYIDLKNSLDTANAQYVRRRLINEEEKLKYTEENIDKIDKEIQILLKQKNEFNQQLVKNNEEIKIKEKEIEAKIGPEYTEIKSNIENAKIAKALSENSISREKDQLNEKKSELETQKGHLEVISEELSKCIKTVSETQVQLDIKQHMLKDAKEENDRISEELKGIGWEYKTLQDKLVKLDHEFEKNNDEKHKIRSQIVVAETINDELSRAIALLEEQIANSDFEIKDVEWDISKIKEKVKSSTDINQLGKNILEMKKQESELEKQEREASNLIRRISQDYNVLVAEKKVTEKIRVNDAVLAILDMRDKGTFKGIHGTIAELGSVNSEYAMALSIAAGGKMQAVVVDNDEVATRVIAELKKKGFGRATFLPLNKMAEGRPRAKAIMAVKESLGYAIDLIKFKPEYRSAFWYVFTDTIVVDTIANARRLMGGIRIVTKSGELFESSGAITGGSSKIQTIKFGMGAQSKLDEISMELRTANQSFDVIKSKLDNIRANIRATDDQIREAKANNIELQGEITRLEIKLKEFRDKRNHLKIDLDKKKIDYSSSNRTKNDLNVSLTELSKKIETLQQERQKVRMHISEIAPDELQQRMQVATDNVYKITCEQNELVNKLVSLNSDKSEYENNRKHIEKEIKTLEKGIEENIANIEKENEELVKIKINLEALRSIEAKMEANIKDLTNYKDKLIENKYKLENSRDNIVSGIETKNGIKATVKANLMVIQKSINDLKIQISESIVKLDGPIPSEETLRRTIKACENSIANFGNVNLRAIDDYDVKKQRYDKLTSDLEKLNTQINGLNNLMDDLEKKKKGLFMETYNGVNKNFKAIFSELSGGGESYMVLEDENSPFEGGLLINVKPKNGKMLRLDSLSGGEKSLTALAFIFAIQEYQPSPFYVFDEIDMFLDSVNSEMVARHIKECSKKTQFIQVSLRKVTLSFADHLIGVTRPPDGVSKVIMQPDFADVSKYEVQRKIR